MDVDLYNDTYTIFCNLITKPKPTIINNKDSKPDITKLYGTLKLNMSVEEIDKQLKALRNEWERDF